METVRDEKDMVLVVDNEQMIGEMIGAPVEDHGCAHASLNNPAEALRHYEENSQKQEVSFNASL
jgi:hypothetical protein